MFDMDRHFSFFGMDVGKFKFAPRFGGHPFMIKATWRKEPKEVMSIGAGLHVMQMLVLGSFCGYFLTEKLHQKVFFLLDCFVLS